jgi:flagellar biosynthetic protein FliP
VRRFLLLTLALTLLAGPAVAQSFSVDFGNDGSLATRSIEILLLVTVLSIVPGLAVRRLACSNRRPTWCWSAWRCS